MSLKIICFMQIHKPSLNRGLCRHHWSLYPHLLKLYNCDNRIALCRYYDLLPIAPTAICLLDTNAYLLSKQSCIVSSHRKYYINDPDQALSHWQWIICPIERKWHSTIARETGISILGPLLCWMVVLWSQLGCAYNTWDCYEICRPDIWSDNEDSTDWIFL